jgi:hypothetical protein
MGLRVGARNDAIQPTEAGELLVIPLRAALPGFANGFFASVSSVSVAGIPSAAKPSAKPSEPASGLWVCTLFKVNRDNLKRLLSFQVLLWSRCHLPMLYHEVL